MGVHVIIIPMGAHVIIIPMCAHVMIVTYTQIKRCECYYCVTIGLRCVAIK